MWRRQRKALFTFSVTSDEPRCTVVFEPVGAVYELAPGDEVVVHVYERSSAERPDDDVEIQHEQDRVLLWLPPLKYRVWNKAGDELQV
jgi:protein involved in polysaccharide export with SLBB domain